MCIQEITKQILVPMTQLLKQLQIRKRALQNFYKKSKVLPRYAGISMSIRELHYNIRWLHMFLINTTVLKVDRIPSSGSD